MHHYDSLSEALEGLRTRGYTENFNLLTDCLESATRELRLHPEDFTIDEFYRFEGDSNPDDSSVIYAISSGALKGVLVDAYGMYSESMTPAMANKLKVVHE